MCAVLAVVCKSRRLLVTHLRVEGSVLLACALDGDHWLGGRGGQDFKANALEVA